MRFWYCRSLSRWFFISRIALSSQYVKHEVYTRAVVAYLSWADILFELLEFPMVLQTP
jgi:hypothetical protein